MLRRSVVLLLVMGAAPPVTAQSTIDGVRALVRGDERTAVQILRRLGEDTTSPDPLAQFFLGIIYESSSTIAINPVQACRSYNAASQGDHPLRRQALDLSNSYLVRGPAVRDLCTPLRPEDYRAWPKASFTLEPGHVVTIDRDGTTVTLNGTTKTTLMVIGGAGWVYPPVRFRSIVVAGSTPIRRHFIELFVWLPPGTPVSGGSTNAWTLSWSVYEVVGLDVRAVIGLPLAVATFAGTSPPDGLVDVDAWATVRAAPDGGVEWALPMEQRAGAIPPRDTR